MGSGSSAAASSLFDTAKEFNLNHEQRQRYKAYYTELQAKGMSEAKINEKLLEKVRAELPDKDAEVSLRKKKAIAELVRPSQKLEEPRSLRVSKSNALLHKPEIKIDKPSVNIPHIPEEGDVAHSSTKSHHIKHYCDVCQTGFKTAQLLERHFKYSHLHARLQHEQEVLKKQEARAKQVSTLVHENIRKVILYLQKREIVLTKNPRDRWLWAYDKVKTNIAIAKTAEMLKRNYRKNLRKSKLVQAKLWYDGSKLFWRTGDSIELHMYMHDDEATLEGIPNKSPVLEVIGFDVERQKELPRMYLYYDVLRAHLHDDIKSCIMNARENNFVKLHKKMDEASEAFDFNSLKGEEKLTANNMICEFIVSKLNLLTNPKVLAFGKFADDFLHDAINKMEKKAAKLNINDNSKTPDRNDTINTNNNSLSNVAHVIPAGPKDVPENVVIDEKIVLRIIQPVEIIRRRRTTENERDVAMYEVKKTGAELTYHTAQATEHALKTNVEVRERKGLKHENYDQLDEVVEKYSNILKDQLAEAAAVIVTEDDIKRANNELEDSIGSKNGRSTKNPKQVNDIENSRLVLLETEEEKNMKSFMKPTASHHPDRLFIVKGNEAVPAVAKQY